MHIASQSAIKVGIVAMVVFITTSALAGWMWLYISEQGNLYHEQLQLAAAVTEREATAQALYQVVYDTTEQRAAIESYFLDVVEIAVFLEQIERYAEANQLILESDQLQEISADEVSDLSQIRIPYQLEGSRDQIIRFINLLETVPYHGYLERMQIISSRSNPDVASATVVIVLSYKRYDRE